MKPAFRLVALVVAAFVAFALHDAKASSAPQIEVHVDADTVGVGDVVQFEMRATSDEMMPSSPNLGAAGGFVVRAENPSTMQNFTIGNGSRVERDVLTVDWVLEATRVGVFAIGPPSVVVGGTRYAAHGIKVHVVPAGQAPRRARPAPPQQSPFGFSPFDPWRQLMPGFGGNDREPAPQPQVTIDPKLNLEATRGDLFFLHATVDRTSAVVGEQVTFSVYQYADTAPTAQFVPDDAHEPDVPDFIKHPLVEGDHESPVTGYAAIGGRIWEVRLAFRWALFPLRTGDLVIGPMTLDVARPTAFAGQKRTTETLRVHVTEPPISGRPPGYATGDVGHFELSAQVQPREIEQGGAVGVHVDLSGTGNLPGTIVPPAREGVDWLAPELHDTLGPIAGRDAYGGRRSFEFVVHVARAGDVNLGDLTLPYWDPEQKRYLIARAPLGNVHVIANSAASAKELDKPAALLPGLPPVRERLEGIQLAGPHHDDSLLFWLTAVAGGPLAFGLAVALRHVGTRVVRAHRGRRASPGAELKDRVSAARAACGGRDARAADSAIGRALEAATLAHAGVNVRGAVGREVTERLERAGVDAGAASSVADLLRECEAARFAPDDVEVAAARARWTRAQAAIRQLERRG